MSSFMRGVSSSFPRVQFARPFWFLLSGSMLNAAGNFVGPFFVLYLTSIRHLSISETTLIISLMGIGSLSAGICGGVLADILGRRRTIMLSLIGSAGFMLTLGFLPSLPLIIPAAILSRFSSALANPAISAAVVDLVPDEKRAQALSLRYWTANIGSALGPIVAGLLAPLSYVLLFVGDALTTLCFSGLIWFGLPETRLPSKTAKRIGQIQVNQIGIKGAFTDLRLWGYAFLALLFDCVYWQKGITLPLDMHSRGLGTLAYGSLLAVNALQVVLISLPLTALFARQSSLRTLSIAALMMGLGMGLQGMFHSYLGYVFTVVIWTCGEILNYPTSYLLIARLSPPQLRGSYQGIFSTVRATSLLVAPFLGGLVLEHLGSSFLWFSCFLLCFMLATSYHLIGVTRLARVKHTLRKPSPEVTPKRLL